MLEPLCAEQKVNCIGASQEFTAALELPGNAGVIVVWISEDGLSLEWRWLGANQARDLCVHVAPSDESAATSLAWCHVKSQPVLCVGFRHGGVSLFTQEGEVIVSFLLATSPVLRIRTCPGERRGPMTQEEESFTKASERLMFLHDHGLLILVALDSLSDQESLQDIDFEVYELRGRACIADACAIPGARSLEDPFSILRGGCDSVAVVALGSQPFLSLHQRPVSSASGSNRSLMATALALGSYARLWVLRKPSDSVDCGGPVKIAGFAQTNELQVSNQIPATELPVVAKFIDSARQGEILSLAPADCGPSAMVLAVSCDTFGRVALFCMETLRCLHLWKGYRDAQVAWLGHHKFAGDEWDSTDDMPGLVIYAPRRGLLELWQLCSKGCTPKRIAASCVGSECLLLSEAGRACLLWPTGQVDRLVWPLGASTSPTSRDDDAFDSADSDVGEPSEVDPAKRACCAGHLDA